MKFSSKKSSNENYKNSTSPLNLLVGTTLKGYDIILPEKALYQNFLITGTIGSRKNFILYVSFYKTTFAI